MELYQPRHGETGHMHNQNSCGPSRSQRAGWVTWIAPTHLTNATCVLWHVQSYEVCQPCLCTCRAAHAYTLQLLETHCLLRVTFKSSTFKHTSLDNFIRVVYWLLIKQRTCRILFRQGIQLIKCLVTSWSSDVTNELVTCIFSSLSSLSLSTNPSTSLRNTVNTSSINQSCNQYVKFYIRNSLIMVFCNTMHCGAALKP
jgi:hypothetical protein